MYLVLCCLKYIKGFARRERLAKHCHFLLIASRWQFYAFLRPVLSIPYVSTHGMWISAQRFITSHCFVHLLTNESTSNLLGFTTRQHFGQVRCAILPIHMSDAVFHAKCTRTSSLLHHARVTNSTKRSLKDLLNSEAEFPLYDTSFAIHFKMSYDINRTYERWSPIFLVG